MMRKQVLNLPSTYAFMGACLFIGISIGFLSARYTSYPALFAWVTLGIGLILIILATAFRSRESG